MPPPKLLIANRGEIALRIQRTASKLGIPTVAIYTLADAAAPHVTAANEAYAIGGDGADHRGYLDAAGIVDIARQAGATMVAPGYGFLSENASFAQAVEDAGIVFLGPTPAQISSMGLKHEARALAKAAGVPIVPGSDGAVSDLELAVEVAKQVGYPVIVKASGGGGGMGMQVCKDEAELRANFEATRDKGAKLFNESTVFIERYIERARHVEVQVFGNGEGHVIHMGERECSVQRRHQKVIEEAPCSLFSGEKGEKVREAMCTAAVNLCKAMNYRSAGTVEFVLDDLSPNLDFFFLELNARLQVEHGVTEAIYPGLDIVDLMIRQGMSPTQSLAASELEQKPFLTRDGHSIEVRVYCENPSAGFQPSPGLLAKVEWGDVGERGRIDTWVKTGTTVSPYYDPMIAKLIVHAPTRAEAVDKMIKVLSDSEVFGPPNNIDYCRAILDSEDFRNGQAYTTWLSTFKYSPPAVEVLEPGIQTTVQDYPGRLVGLGLPRCGPADGISFQAANLLVGNPPTTEGLECTMKGPKLLFHRDAVVAVTGADMPVTLDGAPVDSWTTLKVKAGQTLNVGMESRGTGLRSYIAVQGGFINIAPFMNSKSTFTGAALGGYQGRTLLKGDLLELAVPKDTPLISVPPEARPQLTNTWSVGICAGAQWDLEYISAEGMEQIVTVDWKVSPTSARSGLRLDGPVLKWARTGGGEGGSHPSNVIDQGYAWGSLNLNGDTAVLFSNDSPDMGGFSCLGATAWCDFWKMGQMRPSDTINFHFITPAEAQAQVQANEAWLRACVTPNAHPLRDLPTTRKTREELTKSSVLHRVPATATTPERTFRQASDRFLLYEVGPMVMDLANRVRVELWERAMIAANIKGIVYMNASVRSNIVHFDPAVISMEDLLARMVEIDAGIVGGDDIELDINIVRFPVVPDDKWTREAVEYYMHTARKEAVYLPSNFEYIARNNGMTVQEVRGVLTDTPWVVLCLGFFVELPFMILDPRRRILGQKYNPSRTKTPEGAIGLAGVIGAIYPIASAGGYQLLGRTLSTWNTWAQKHSLVGNFDQVEFFEVTEDEYERIERNFKAGSWKPEIRQSKFRMRDYIALEERTKVEAAAFKKRQLEESTKVAKEEEKLFAQFLKDKEAELASGGGTVRTGDIDGEPVTSPLSATVWKVLVEEGAVIEDDDQQVVELEAMKTSVFVNAGSGAKGKKVTGITVAHGDAVSPGSSLLYLA